MTDHTSMELATLDALRARLEQVERERDTARRDYEVMNKLREGAEQERDALADHLSKVPPIMSRLASTPAYRGGPRPPAVEDYLDWAFSKPDTSSLTRRDAKMKAEAIHALHNRYQQELGGNGSISGLVHDMLVELRQQAEGGES